MRTRFAAGVLIALAVVAVLWPQPAAGQSAVDNARQSLAAELRDRGTPFSLQDVDYIALIAHRSSTLVRLLQEYEDERADEQIGATSSASGSTTLASKGTVPRILALAVENGAITQSQSGTTVTFRTNIGGAVRALAGNGLLQLDAADDPAVGLLGHISLSASLDTARGASVSSPVLTADQQQLSQWTFRWQVLDRRDIQSKGALEKWRSRVAASLRTTSTATGRLYEAVAGDPAAAKWVADTSESIKAIVDASAGRPDAAVIADIETALTASEMSFPVFGQLQPATREALEEFDRSASSFARQRQELLREIASGALVTAEYTSDRPLGGSNLSNFRLVGEIGGTIDLTANASLTMFDTVPVGETGRIRDFQFAGQADIKLGSVSGPGPFTLSIAGRYLRQLQNSITSAGIVLPDTTGTIFVGQIKLQIPVKGSGVRIPFSLTFANRTDLIKERVVRGNVGVTYDLDSLFLRFVPGIRP